MAKNTRIFSDIDLNFLPHPNTGDIGKKFDENAIKASVKHLVMTNHYERRFHPEIGSQVRALLFEPFGPLLDAMLKKAITNTIINHEPRVRLLSVEVNSNPDNNSIYVAIVFTIVNSERPITVDFILNRTR